MSATGPLDGIRVIEVGTLISGPFAGRLLGQGGRFADPVARLGPRPLLASVPAATWGTDEPQFFLMVKAVNTMRRRLEKQKEAAPPAPPPADVVLLTEIRDLLARK